MVNSLQIHIIVKDDYLSILSINDDMCGYDSCTFSLFHYSNWSLMANYAACIIKMDKTAFGSDVMQWRVRVLGGLASY